MEFFTWMVIPQIVIASLTLQLKDNDITTVLAHENKVLVISLIVAAVLFLAGHLFGGFGLYKMAKRQGDKLAWMAFVPILNTYLAGRLAGEANVFGAKVKHMGVYAAIAEAVYVVLEILLLCLAFFLADPRWNRVIIEEIDGTAYITGTEYVIENMPLAMRWMPTAEFALQIVVDIWSFVQLGTFIFLYMAFFRKYYARGPLIMAFLCSLLPVRGYVLFAVRNNTPVDYNQWMQERIRRMQQQQAQQYGYPPQPPYGSGPYGGQPYGGQPYGTNGGADSGEPFSDTTGTTAPPKDDEPFSDL